MLLTSTRVDPDAFTRETGWTIKPEGACMGEVCVPLGGDGLDATTLAERLGMGLVHDVDAGLWALGPAVGVTGRALTTAVAPDLVLPTIDGEPFHLSSLRGTKVVLLSWASW